MSLLLCYQPGPVPFEETVEMARSLKAKDFLVPGKCFLIHKFQWVFHQHGVFSIKTGRLT